MNRANKSADGSLDGVEAWRKLREQRYDSRVQNRKPRPITLERVGSVLDFLGLPYAPETAPFDLRGVGPNSQWLHLAFESEPLSQPKGMPLFGSQAGGVYHVFCLWNARPDRIWSVRHLPDLSHGNQNAVILFYLDALTAPSRNEIKRKSWELDSTIAVVDELLIGFLARYNDQDRFKAFLRTALPYSAANPYFEETDKGAIVPPEMFYGRDDMVRDIQRMRGGKRLIFGGRQLGKTNLLKHVEGIFNNGPNERRYAKFINIKNRTPEEVVKTILGEFAKLRNGDAEGVSLSESGGDGGDMREILAKVFDEDRQLEVLLLFDEADAFLEKDSENNFPVIEAILDVMNETGRFKVVFAGLHSAQRIAYAPNNPLPKFGFDENAPRRGGIGPLLHKDAQKLVEEPLSALGFQMDNMVVQNILSYTYCHPSLTQFFCHQLIKTFREEYADANPPFAIGRDDVDRVYRMSHIRDGIKWRFEETFRLDPRYHAICLSMFLDQTQNRARKWTLEDVRESCAGLSDVSDYCSLTFDRDNMRDRELKSLLDELVGLGVLAEVEDSYSFRNERVASMFGSESDILNKLIELDDNV